MPKNEAQHRKPRIRVDKLATGKLTKKQTAAVRGGLIKVGAGTQAITGVQKPST